MTIAGELINILGFKIEGQDKLRQYNKSMDDTENSAKRTASRIKGIAAAAGITTTAAIALGVQGFKNFAAFERQMNRIGITAGATAKQTAAASETVQRLARDFAMPIEQAVTGLDTLVASGMDLEQAMSFLPSVLATAQAAGAATEDIANTAQKTASALKLETSELQYAFDIMVAGGKAGQFELKDMAKFIPELSNSFASLGYDGTDGLKKLIALLQTLREDTGSASAAATQAQNIFGKMYTEETANKFSKMGIDIRKEMEAGKKAGEEALETFVRVSKEAIKGDLSKLPLLFTDQEFRLGMQSLITSGDSLEKFFNVLNNADVEGGAMRDLGVIIQDNQAKIDRLATSWDSFMKSIGAAVSGPVGATLDAVTMGIARDQAINRGLEKQGKGWLSGRIGMSAEEGDQLARQEGFVKPGDEGIAQSMPNAYRVLGRAPQRPKTTVGRPDPTATSAVGAQSMIEAGFDNLAARVEALNGNLAQMTGQAPVDAVITDARQDNRSFPMSVSAPVTVNVSQPSSAPAALGAALGDAIGKAAAAQSTRTEVEPAF